ncbi:MULTISPECIES: hypothetical protein [unclassified Curtobacterium]|uniref:hypothetical protein n=1 Tax=unclassified Curtobacterium TaxID=257496 RepID=UPI000824D117|nr:MULTISPECIES: hypothetical protein [unclassified Curtobacterium]WIA96162.1 hypothetical protein QOL16_13780 [Curtobacterium sp. MCBA15_004]WIA99464.1 hypothetical protein QOL15_13195 [Curtobacterium sp. MCBA15_012]
MTDNVVRRTKRRYAHELHPAGDGREVRPLAVEVPRLYARALGTEVLGTSWRDGDEDAVRRRSDRLLQLLDARRIAFLADALA